MQVPSLDETTPNPPENPENLEEAESPIQDNNEGADDESVLDVSGKTLEFSFLENSREDKVKGLYLYKNEFNLIPRSLGGHKQLRNLKFFANEINLFPPEFGNLVGLECLQVKISSPGLNGLSLGKLKGLKELELCKVPPRPSSFAILSEIAGLKCLTKLSVCHFSIRYLPPEIGCLSYLEYLDLSFNKMKKLPTEIKYLNALISLKVANNKLVELPSGLSSLQRLENLDLSNNRLTSLGSLELGSMHNLQNLNLQGNGSDTCKDDFTYSSVEMDVYETNMQEIDGSLSRNGSHRSTSSLITGSSSNSRCFSAWKSGKRWKRRCYLQQKARQERLNNSRKWKGDDHTKVLSMKEAENCKPSNLDVLGSETHAEGTSDIVTVDDENQLLSGEAKSENLLSSVEVDEIGSKIVKNCSAAALDSISVSKAGKDKCSQHGASITSMQNGASEQDSEISKSTLKAKRHCDRDLDNPKPCKSWKPTNDSSRLSHKYSDVSFCGIEDHLPDGFYDAGRDRPFMPLRSYEQSFQLDSREVILVDRETDEGLDAIALSAQKLVFHLKQLNGLAKYGDQAAVDSLQIASLLALFVSDHFGGSDRSTIIEKTRKAVSGSNYQKPFVCTCSTGNGTKQILDNGEDIVFSDLCEKSIRSIKARRNSIIVPIGTLQFGVCRHRALLMKYLCDRMEPPIPCELVRGYLDFFPHAWNTILIKRGDSYVRMVVDACRPHDIREEIDPEFFARYIPLRRTKVSLLSKSIPVLGCSFPTLSTCDEIEKAASSSIIRCNIGSVEAVAKVRNLEICGTSVDDIKNFEYSCLGEVRILGALNHPCIVEMYGHQISSKWVSSADGNVDSRILRSSILMEYIKGGSLKRYVDKLSEAGEKHVPVELAMCIARGVANALVELHSKHIIHRDIKSENILIDLDRKTIDGTPVVKLCDFDRAVPLRSFMHTCCIAHVGIPPPNTCVGTPRWMAPEVLRAMHKPNVYGLEVDIWSYGCLLLELLTLQIPYAGLPEFHIHDLLQNGKRPQLTDELEALGIVNEPAMDHSVTELEGSEAELETMRFLVNLFRQCTEQNPSDRPTAVGIYEMLLAHSSNFTSSS